MTTTTYPRARRNTRPLIAPWVRLIREPGQAPTKVGLTVRAPAEIAQFLTPRAAVEEVEVFWLVALSAQNRVIALAEVTRGTLTSSLVHPREVFRLAIANGAAGIIVPSADDRAVTRQLADAGRLLEIPLYDHLILNGEGYFSFAEAGLL